MKKTFMKFVTAVFAFLLFFQPTQAQETATAIKGEAVSDGAPLASSLLWKVSGENIKDSYVYGTIHLIAETDFFLDDNTKDAFGKTEQIVFELDMDDPAMQMEMMQKASMKDGQTLDKLISEEDYKKLDEMAKKTMGIGMDMFKTWQPILVSSIFLPSLIGEKTTSYEMTFMQMAMQNKIEILGLETIGDQIDALGSIPYDKQAESLMDIVNKPEEGAKMFEDLVTEYKEQDIYGLLKMMKEQDDHDTMGPAMLENRNKNWIPKIGEYASDKSTFFAVGAGHLAGEEGVLNLLKEAGYEVTPMMAK